MEPTQRPSLWQRIREMFFHRYLVQLIVTALCLVMIPCCLSFWGFFHYSYTQMQRSNDAYYMRSAEMFTQLFTDKVTDIKRHAAQICVDSRNPKRPAYQMQREALLSAPVNYYTVFARVLTQYDYTDCDWGIYYPEYDILFAENNKHTVDTYLAYCDAQYGDTEYAPLRGFFCDDDPSGVQFCPLYNADGTGCLYVGIPGKLGIAGDNALFFYRLNAQALNLHSIVSPSTSSARFFLWDEDELLYANGSPAIAQDTLLSLIRSGATRCTLDGVEYALVTTPNKFFSWSSTILLPFDQVNASILRFYQNTQFIFIGMVAMLLFTLGILVYINYHPLRQTLLHFGLHSHNEWDSLQNAFTQMQDEMLEQNQLILDFLLKNLLYGVPISQTDIVRLGLHAEDSAFCVYTLAGTLTTQQRLDLSHALKQRLRIEVYTTDILNQDYSVMICLTKKGLNPEQLHDFMIEYFKTELTNCALPHKGCIVDDINQIRDSYLSCFEEPADEKQSEEDVITMPDPNDRRLSNRRHALKEQVESYIQQNIGDCSLSQTSVADYFGISVYSLSRLFKNYIGVGFSDYVNSLRLEAARELLLQTEQSIKDISAQVGMPNSSYFSRLFKLKYEVSPAQMRKEYAMMLDQHR